MAAMRSAKAWAKYALPILPFLPAFDAHPAPLPPQAAAIAAQERRSAARDLKPACGCSARGMNARLGVQVSAPAWARYASPTPMPPRASRAPRAVCRRVPASVFAAATSAPSAAMRFATGLAEIARPRVSRRASSAWASSAPHPRDPTAAIQVSVINATAMSAPSVAITCAPGRGERASLQPSHRASVAWSSAHLHSPLPEAASPRFAPAFPRAGA